MTDRCQNCDRPLLKSDTKCFHCDMPVPGREPTIQALEASQVDLRTAVRYGGLVLALMVVGALLLNWMGAGVEAQAASTPTPAAPAGWQEYVPPEVNYRVWLPADWVLFIPDNPDWKGVLDRAPHPLPGSFGSFAPSSPEERTSLVAWDPAESGRHPLMVTVELHSGLLRFNLVALQVDNWFDGGRQLDTTRASSLVIRNSGDSALFTELVYPVGGDEVLHTIIMMIKTGRGVYAVTVSAAEEDFLLQEESLWQILDSFATLDVLQSIDVRDSSGAY